MRNRSKKIIALLLSISMILPFSACKKENIPADEASMVVMDAYDAVTQLANAEAEYGYDNALSELTEKSTSVIDGDRYYRLQQHYQGIPVYGRTVVCAVDEDGKVTSLTGNVEDVDPGIELVLAVTADSVTESIRSYFRDVLKIENANNARVDSLDKDDLCIYVDDNGTCRLAYCIYYGAYEFVIDAYNGQMLSSCLTLQEDNIETADGCAESDHSKVFPVEKHGENNYIMYDPVRKLRVYTLNYQISGDGTTINHNLAELVQSADVIFGNTEEEKRLEYEKGAALYQKAIFLHKYFDALNFDPIVDGVYLYYNDQFCDGENALGGILTIAGEVTGVVSMGSERNAIDTVAHEYTHYVSRNVVNWNGSDETGALNEAMSDLFGELVESAYKSKDSKKKVEPDWIHGSRNMIDPSQNGYPEKTTDKNKSKEDFTHGYSTVITHAAYLMWNGIDGTDSKKISTDELAKLWYRAMLMMPANCDFRACRQLVELAATSMELTTAQIACVGEAFDKVGITAASDAEESEATYKISRNSKLSVRGGDGNLCDNYILVMAQKKLVNLGSGGVRITRHITSDEPYDLSGLTEGNYTFTITDGENANNTLTFTVSVKEKYEDTNIQIATNFGGRMVRGTVSEIRKIDGVETNVPIDNAVVTIYSHDREDVVNTIHMSETDGFFEAYLPVGNYSFMVEAEGYISLTSSFELTSEKERYLELILEPDVEPVTDAYEKKCTFTAKMYNYETGKSENKEITCTYRIPQINLPGNTVEKINSEIYNALYPVIEDAVEQIDEYGFPYVSEEISYRWAVNGDILSLVILNRSAPDHGGGDRYMVYNIDVSSGEKVSAVSLAQAAGFSEQAYYERARQVLGSSFWSVWGPSNENFQNQSFVDFFNDRLKRTISDENIAQSYPYINEKGQLCIVAKKYSLAAGDFYWHDLNMIEFELLPYYADQAENQSPSNDYTEQTEAEDPTESGSETITVQDLLGEWIVDADYTMEINGISMWDIYGSSFSQGGNKMTFGSDGSFGYYVAWCFGNGSFELQNGEIVVNLDEGEPNKGTVKLKVMTDGGIMRIALDQYGDGNLVFWVKA